MLDFAMLPEPHILKKVEFIIFFFDKLGFSSHILFSSILVTIIVVTPP